jgi:hypothetical protein
MAISPRASTASSVIAQDGQPHAARVGAGAPVHVEEVGVLRALPALQHVAPPRVVRRRGHVVRHDVQQDAHAVTLDVSSASASQRVLAAHAATHACRVRHVVAVGAARPASKMGDRYTS